MNKIHLVNQCLNEKEFLKVTLVKTILHYIIFYLSKSVLPRERFLHQKRDFCFEDCQRVRVQIKLQRMFELVFIQTLSKQVVFQTNLVTEINVLFENDL